MDKVEQDSALARTDMESWRRLRMAAVSSAKLTLQVALRVGTARWRNALIVLYHLIVGLVRNRCVVFLFLNDGPTYFNSSS